MAAHRLALATVLAASSLAAAGCGSGKDTDAFLPADPPVAATPVAPAPAAPVIVGGPSQEAVAGAPAMSGDVARARAADAARFAERADERRKEARRELRDEREKAERARKRAEQREAALRAALADARKDAREAARPVTRPAPATLPAEPTIGASDVGRDLVGERNARSDAEARAAVVRQHELLDRRDTRACDLLTPAAMTAAFGAAEGALERCQAMVRALTEAVSVTIESSRADGRRATLDVVVHYGDTDLPQTLALALVGGTWMIDGAQRRDR